MGTGERSPSQALIHRPRLGPDRPPVAGPFSIRSSWISTAIQPALQRSTDGRVLNVFPSAAYLANQCGDVLALVSSEVGPGPLAIVLPIDRGFFDRSLRPGHSVQFADKEIRSGRLSIQLTGRPWPARPSWEAIQSPSLLTAGLPILRQSIASFAPPGSLAALLNPVQAGETRFVNEIRRRSGPFLSALADCASQFDPPAESAVHNLETTAAGLGGLGTGFTPAGDDFLLGAIYSVWTWAPEASALILSEAIADAGAPRTTTVSAAYLRAGAVGAAGMDWHRLIGAWAAGDEAASAAAVSRLCRIGHTSGADALAGFALGVERFVQS